MIDRSARERSNGERPAHCGPKDSAKPTDIVSLRPGDFLFREGDLANALYIARKGLLRIVSGSTLYETVRSGGIICEMEIVEQGERRSASVIAGTRSELEKIDTPAFLALIRKQPDFALEVTRVI